MPPVPNAMFRRNHRRCRPVCRIQSHADAMLLRVYADAYIDYVGLSVVRLNTHQCWIDAHVEKREVSSS
eukprot:1216015-Amphidinium_carterae.1